jgi:hypothetical protein
MEENKEKSYENCCGNCCSAGHMHGMGGKYHLLRWMLGLAIIIIVFWLGFKLGEFKGYFDDYGYGKGFGRGMMNYGTNNNDYLQFRKTRNQDYVYPPMMWQWQQPASTTPTK